MNKPNVDLENDLDGRIAVIGMAGRFPGARDLATFWSNLRNGVESIKFLSEEQLLAAGESPETIRDPSYVRANASIDDIDMFDAAFFGMSPRDAAVFDPQHRIFLECAWEAFEHAGYVGATIDGSVGVFASCGLSEYMFKNVLANAQLKQSIGEWLIRHTGNDTNFLATRTSYEMDLRGPSLNVQTACSSTLVALHMACQSLLSGECDVALAGGAVINPTPNRGYFYKEGEILSPDGHCRAFDAESAGTISSDAAGCVLLKPLAAAIDDGDTIFAVVRGSAINNDGRAKVGYLAPSVAGQASVISEALAVAAIDPRDVSYVEMHGTGTLIGDPIEVAALTQAFRQGTDDVQFCAIGSLKPSIGHAGEASGISSFIKTVLALHHAELPPSLHYRNPNPQADFSNSPFFVNDRLRDWKVAQGRRRIAGVTGLGAGGTNAHVILEEAPSTRASGPSRSEQLITVSARTIDGVGQAASELANHLRCNLDVDLADVAFTRLAGRKGFRFRRAVVAATPGAAAAALESADSALVASGEHVGNAPGVVFMMPGGGAQYSGMGRDLYDAEAIFRDAIDACSHHVSHQLDVDLVSVLYPEGDLDLANKRLQSPSLALPSLFATEYATAKLFESWGLSPTAMIGHSAGEYVAACLAGVLTMKEGLDLVALRGRLFETLPSGSMLSVSLSAAEIEPRLPPGLSIAAINAPQLCVVSGPDALVLELQRSLERDDIDCMHVPIDVAAHSSMLDPILAEFRSFCRTISFQAPVIPYVSNLTGTWVSAADVADPEYWVRHLRQPVRFAEGIATILEDPNRLLVEIGPGRTLTGLARLAERPAVASTPSLRHPKETISDVVFALGALGRAWAHGVDIDPDRLFDGEVRKRIPLPTYPFDRQHYWVDADTPDTTRRPTSIHKRHEIAEWFYTPTWRRSIIREGTNRMPDRSISWLLIDDGADVATAIRTRLVARGQAVVSVRFGEAFALLGPDRYAVDPSRSGDWVELVSDLKRSGSLPNHVVHMSAVGPSRGRRLRGLVDDPIAAYDLTVKRDQASLMFLAQALSVESEGIRLAVVTSGVCSTEQGAEHHIERALLHGTCRVIPRELGNMTSVVIDIDAVPSTSIDAVADRLVAELCAETNDDLVSYRGGERWTRQFDPIELPAASTSPWRSGATYLITGGLGGIGLTIAEHIARTTSRSKLVLVGRSPVPPRTEWDTWLASGATTDRQRRQIEAVKGLIELGADVTIERADCTDFDAMARVVASALSGGRTIHGVIHAAGVLQDALIALRSPVAASPVVDVKARGALILDRLLRKHPPSFVLLCSSISSIIGLPGQADYSAANAFLDAFAIAKNAEGHSRFISVNWSAWQEVGMAVDAVRASVGKTFAGVNSPRKIERASTQLTSTLLDSVSDDGARVLSNTAFSRDLCWLLSEHVVRDGQALIPGTGHLELIRETVLAAAASQSSVELSDVVFMSPFVVADGETRTLNVDVESVSGIATVFSENESAPHVSAVAKIVDSGPSPRHDVDSIRARCARRSESFDGFAEQAFMSFGPRWANLTRIDFGDNEALLTLQMPEPYADELETLWLHPALLDTATGGAQALISGFSADGTFYVPFSYGRVLSRRPMTASCFSHVKLRPGTMADTAVFDVVIFDDKGNELIDVQGFTMRLVREDSAVTAHRVAPADRSPNLLETPIEAALREGILPAEGIDACDRLLTYDVGAQVVATAVDLHAWIAKTDAEARVADHPGDGGSGAGQFERPRISVEFEPPATPIERDLASLWQELLGVQEVGRHDDFFELGGQSLVAVRLFTRLRKMYTIDLPLTTLFEAPTIARCAAIIANLRGVVEVDTGVGPTPDGGGGSECGGGAEPSSGAPSGGGRVGEGLTTIPPSSRSLVSISSGGPGQPLFMVHGAGGNVLFLWTLARALSGDRPVFGFQAMGVNAQDRPDATIEEMAARYVGELVEQHQGPYLLGGYSGGGIVTLEMAKQLQALGHEVSQTLLFDSVPPRRPLPPTHFRLLNVLRNARRDGLSSVSPRYSLVKVRRYMTRVLPLASGSGAQNDAAADRALGYEEMDGYVDLYDHFSEVADRYTAGNYDVNVTLFKANQIAPILPFDYYWTPHVAGRLELRFVHGDHHSMFYPEFLPRLAEIVRARLFEIEAEQVTDRRKAL